MPANIMTSLPGVPDIESPFFSRIFAIWISKRAALDATWR